MNDGHERFLSQEVMNLPYLINQKYSLIFNLFILRYVKKVS